MPERNTRGRYVSSDPSFHSLLDHDTVQLYYSSYPETSRDSQMWYLANFLDFIDQTPETFLQLSEDDQRSHIRRACQSKNQEGKYSSARRLYYAVMRFLQVNNQELSFSRHMKRTFLKRIKKKAGYEHIPDRDEIYRMVDTVPNRGDLIRTRDKAILLCLWQSGVRASCLCSWRHGMFQELGATIPHHVKVVAQPIAGVYNVAVDTKLSSYGLGYYYTFLHQEAIEALRDYMEAKKTHGWRARTQDYVFTTELSGSRGRALDSKRLNEIVKRLASQIGLNPRQIWTHVFRKAFRKTLYRAGLDNDVGEALMGHKLQASRGSYFDFQDVTFIEQEYLKGFWQRKDTNQLTVLEEQIADLRRSQQTQSVEDLIRGLARTRQIPDEWLYFVQLSSTENAYITNLEELRDAEEYAIDRRDQGQPMIAVATGAMASRNIPSEHTQVTAQFVEFSNAFLFGRPRQQQPPPAPKQRVISDDKLPSYLAQGWIYIDSINDNKCVIQRRY